MNELSGNGAIVYLQLPDEIKTEVQEALPLQIESKKLTQEEQQELFPIYCKDILKWLGSAAKVLHYMSDRFVSRSGSDDHNGTFGLYLLDKEGKECFLGSADKDTLVVGPFEIKGKTYVAVNNVLYCKTDNGNYFIKSKNQIPAVQYNETGSPYQTRILCAHPEGHYIITWHCGMNKFYTVYQKDDGVFAQEEIYSSDDCHSETAWPVSNTEVALLCGSGANHCIQWIDLTTKKVKKKLSVAKIFKAFIQRYSSEIAEKMYRVEYSHYTDHENWLRFSRELSYYLRNIEYIPSLKKILIRLIMPGVSIPDTEIKNKNVTGENCVLIGADDMAIGGDMMVEAGIAAVGGGPQVIYVAMVNLLHLLTSGKTKVQYEIVKHKEGEYNNGPNLLGSAYEYKGEVDIHFDGDIDTQARRIPYPIPAVIPVVHVHDAIDDMWILTKTACWWSLLSEKDKKLDDGLSLIRAFNNPSYTPSTVQLNYKTSYEMGKPCMSFIYDTVQKCGLLDKMSKDERWFLFKHVHNEVQKCLVKAMIEKIHEDAEARALFARYTYQDSHVFPLFTCIAKGQKACADMMKKQKLDTVCNRWDTSNMNELLNSFVIDHESTPLLPYKFIDCDGEKYLYRMLRPNITFVKQVAIAWEKQDKPALEKILANLSVEKITESYEPISQQSWCSVM